MDRRKFLIVITIGLIAVVGRLAILPLAPAGLPAIHDEFSYLLASDTFASGSLTNPRHPMWRHFESYHIIQEPTYQSKYPPAQGLFLAFGQALFNDPWIGVLLSCGFMSASIYWMLQAWLPPVWALLGGILVIIQIVLFNGHYLNSDWASYWSTSYWGGAVAASGGALFLGALPRLFLKKRLLSGFILALGLIIMINSRPYEGLCLSLSTGVIYLIYTIYHQKNIWSVKQNLKIIYIILCTILISSMLMMYYNYSVTGDFFKIPYTVYNERYHCNNKMLPFVFNKNNWTSPCSSPLFIKKLKIQQSMEQQKTFGNDKSYTAFCLRILYKVLLTWKFFFGVWLAWPILLFGPLIIINRKIRLLILILIATGIGVALLKPFHPHYVAPLTGIFYVIIIQGIRYLNALNCRGKRVGRVIVRINLFFFILFTLFIPLVKTLINLTPVSVQELNQSNLGEKWYINRYKIKKNLEEKGGKHLVIVRYKSSHNFHQEWVYNEANIDVSSVIWAREVDADRDSKLINYFCDRNVWLLEVDAKPLNLSPYRGQLEKAE